MVNEAFFEKEGASLQFEARRGNDDWRQWMWVRGGDEEEEGGGLKNLGFHFPSETRVS